MSGRNSLCPERRSCTPSVALTLWVWLKVTNSARGRILRTHGLLHLGSIEWTISGLFWPRTATFDLIAGTTSFDHSTDRHAGLVEWPESCVLRAA
jgi:hypothetical protein